jgi:hypothetical protein
MGREPIPPKLHIFIINIVFLINVGDRLRANMKQVALEGVENNETIRNYLLSAKPPRGTKHHGTGGSSCSTVYSEVD